MLRSLLFHGLAAILTLPCALAQTLAIHNDIQTHATLTGTTVTMTGRSELRLTGATAPLTGSTVHLNSPDAWLFLNKVRPSVVNSSYTGLIRINGAVPVHNNNCRIVQHADGSVVIPHASTFAGMEVFSGPNFTGTALSLQNYTSYSNTSLGVLADNVSSFRLRRGYSVTLAQNANGSGISRNYVAQDGDIEVALLPGELDDSVSFARVIPWRWVGKKGSCDVDPLTLDARWHYNWSNNQTSPLDWEYIPIRQQRWWPDYPNDKRESTHLLGFNEPDNPVEDAYTSLNNGSVDAAIAVWPELQQSGLRLGSPAVTDGGEAWLDEFITKADAANLRVDFVAIHFYRCGFSASQLYSWLYNIHVRTGRPLWVTEFNNGANWTSCADPTLAQNATAISGFIDMMNDAPFIERYAVYSNVEDVRKMVNSSSVLTPAGVVYRDTPSPLSYRQVIPEVPAPASAHYRFENDARDSSAYGHSAILQGGAKFTTGRNGQAVALSGAAASGDYVQLSSRLGDSTDFSFGAWVYPTSSAQWQRIFDLGSSTTRYLFLSPAAGSGNLRFAIKNGSAAEQQLNHTAPLPLNTWTHVAVTISGNTGKLFLNGAVVATNTGMSLNPSSVASESNFLGKSRFEADPLFAGRLDEVQFLHYALTDAQVAAMPGNSPPQFATAALTAPNATPGAAYSASLAGTATDPDAATVLTYSKGTGPAWLVVAANGALSGTPAVDDSGSHEFLIRVADPAGASAFTLLTIQVPTTLGNGTWTANADGLWSEPARWTASFPANGVGNTANFSTLNITADRTVTLDTPRQIGSLIFGDTTGTQNWTLTAASGRTLTLETASGSPSIAVNQNTATVSAPLQGTAGFTKSGPGTLILGGANPISGTLFLDVNSSSAAGGAVRLAAPLAGNSLTGIQIRNNNSGFSTLELDGTSGNVTTTAAAPFSLAGRSGTVPAIRNLAGTNTLSGAITLQAGGVDYQFLSDAGTLTLAGGITSAASGARTLTFRGAGSTVVSGVLSNGSAASGLGIVKNDAGTLTLSGPNTANGPTVVNGGTLLVTGTTGTGAVTIANAGTLGGTGTLGGNLTVQSGGTLAPGVGIGKLTVSASITLMAGSTTRMEINQTAGTRDTLAATGALTFGGNLAVTLVAGSLTAGNSFTLFEGPSLSGSFASVALPTLPSGLAWDSSRLGSGILAVVPSPSGYATWAAAYVFPAGLSGPGDDADRDGMANAFEWILGADPLNRDPAFLPRVRVRPLTTSEYPAAAAGKSYLTLTARVRKLHPGITLVGETVPSLPWPATPDPAGIVPSFAVSVSSDFEDRTWFQPTVVEDSGGGRRFMRLRLTVD